MAHIETFVDGHVLEIRINRPEKMNALSPEMYQDIALALGKLDRDPELRVGLIYAEGKHFSAGIELDKWGSVLSAGNGFPKPIEGIDPFVLDGRYCRKPVVMAMQGYCFTWAVEVMLTCDVRVASRDTSFGMLEVKRGIFPCAGATIRLPAQMGWGNAQRYLLTGDQWSAEEAYRTGLVQELVAPGEQLARGRSLALSIASAAPMAVAAILKSSRLARTGGEQVAAPRTFEDLPQVLKSEDAKEGMLSFVERREAVFKGR